MVYGCKEGLYLCFECGLMSRWLVCVGVLAPKCV